MLFRLTIKGEGNVQAGLGRLLLELPQSLGGGGGGEVLGMAGEAEGRGGTRVELGQVRGGERVGGRLQPQQRRRAGRVAQRGRGGDPARKKV